MLSSRMFAPPSTPAAPALTVRVAIAPLDLRLSLAFQNVAASK